MKENTNKAIVINTIILYARLIVNTICGLFTTRFALSALGITDFGLYSVTGSIIAFIAVINSIMVVTSNRFIAIAIGKGNIEAANEQFNVNLLIHVAIAIFSAVVAIPLGIWYIHNYVNYDGPIANADMVFVLSIVGSIISFIGVPYNGLLMAKEKFIVFSTIDSISHIIKLIAAACLSLVTYRLFTYSLAIAFCTAYPTFIYIMYCNKHYSEIARWKIVKSMDKYKSVFGFVGWVGYGGIASIGKTQGAALLVNAFFNTVMNTALGVANTIFSLVAMFAQNLTKTIAPQITKNYAVGNMDRCITLLIMASKYSFFLMLIIAVPFIVETEYIIELWLGQVPPYSVIFTRLIIVEALIDSLNNGIGEIVFANGKIAFYQFTTNTIRLLAILAGYFVLRSGCPAYYLMYCYIVFTIIVLFVKQVALNKTIKINNWILLKKAYLPSLLVATLVVPSCFIKLSIHPIVHIFVLLVYVLGIMILFGTNREEKDKLRYIINRFQKKNKI